MFGWIRDNIGIKNFFILTLVIIAMVGFIKGPSWYKLIKGNQYECVAKAKVTSITAKDITSQHINGTNTKTMGYNITYVYEVDNKKYSNSEFIKLNDDMQFILEQFNSVNTCTIEIKYSIKSPSESIISKLNPR